MHHMHVDNLRQAFLSLSGSKATGIDRITKDQYANSLQENLEALANAIARGGWRPKPSREVLIPKPQGGTRPLAVGCVENRIVQTLTARILDAVYEPLFLDRSYGFRSGKSAHQAVADLYQTVERHRTSCTVVEVDLEKFFNTIDHAWLLAKLSERIADSHFVRHIQRLLRNAVLHTDGTLADTVQGTPQGSPVSPVLANIALHYLADEWFRENWAMHGEMIRYADDITCVFRDETSARAFLDALEKNIAQAGLRLNRDKCKVTSFSSSTPKGTIRFLGFEFYWGKMGKQRNTVLKAQTDSKRLNLSMQAFTDWIKLNRNRFKLQTLWDMASVKLAGHYGYFGVRTNQPRLQSYYWSATQALYKWLNRRSQTRSMSMEKFLRRLRFNPLPRPPSGIELVELSRLFGFGRNHKPKSRMREIRKSGSERSASQVLVFT
jgi:group II intron reverse transcriptase/maturase